MPKRYPRPCLPAIPNTPRGHIDRGEEPACPDSLPEPKKTQVEPAPAKPGYVFAKCSKLPDAVIDYANEQGPFPIDTVKDYGSLVLLGGAKPMTTGNCHFRKSAAPCLPALAHWPCVGLPQAGPRVVGFAVVEPLASER